MEDQITEDQDLETETYKKYRKISITLPNNVAEKAEQYAQEHGLKRSQVLALALERGLGDDDRIFRELNSIKAMIKKNNRMAKSTSKEEKEIEDEKTSEEIVLTNEQRESINDLLVDCTSSFSRFEIMGADGFLVQVRERQIIGSIWTDEMLQTLAEHLSVGYDDWYISKPEPQELMDACAEAMELSQDQQNKLIEYFARSLPDFEYIPPEETTEEESEKGEK